MQMMGGAEFADQYLDRGIAHFQQNRFREALMFFDASLQFNPRDPHALWNRATALLSMGDYERGFAEYDAAWEAFPVVGQIQDARLTRLPIWRGETGARVLVYHEHGFGDAIMAFRFLPEMKRRAELTLLAEWPLARLAGRLGVKAIDKIMPNEIAGFDFRVQLFCVMSVLKTIPSAPYIATDWRRTGGKVGIAWSGKTQDMFTQADFLQLLQLDGFELYSLQAAGPTDTSVVPMKPGCDFADVADRIAEMDHVVTVDTASIHLAGAMGHPSAHLVLPFSGDWRWWHTERWYPNVKTYRQENAKDWAGPFARLNKALTQGVNHG